MKLSEPFKVASDPSPEYFARALRAIGQDIGALFPQHVEIDFREPDFEARVRCHRKRLESITRDERKKGMAALLNRIGIHRFGSRAKSADLITHEQIYSPEDIRRLDQKGFDRRVDADKVPDIRSLAEALRTIGRIIDSRGGKLIGLVKDQRRVTVEYFDREGARQRTEMTSAELYKLQQRYCRERTIDDNPEFFTYHD